MTRVTERVATLARAHRVAYVATDLDRRAAAIADLVDDPVELDGTQLAIIALERDQILTTDEAAQLQSQHVREKYERLP